MTNGHADEAGSPPPPVSYPAGSAFDALGPSSLHLDDEHDATSSDHHRMTTNPHASLLSPPLPPSRGASTNGPLEQRGQGLPSSASSSALTMLQHQLAIAEAARDRTNEQLLGSYERVEKAEARVRELQRVAEGLTARVQV